MIEDCNDGLKVELIIEIPERMVPRNHKIAIYRIFREAASNAIMHGQADRIIFRLLIEAGKIVLYIEGNGGVFCISRLSGADFELNGNGLKNMRERAEFAGGTLDVRSRIGSSTRIVATFPAKSISS
jgi:two-component system sensor histidine kinase DegS